MFLSLFYAAVVAGLCDLNQFDVGSCRRLQAPPDGVGISDVTAAAWKASSHNIRL